MAKQNFLAGGFYGKLGQTVGQRWKNKRIIRAYVIPRNPRTEKQQANRNNFGNSTKLAQYGMQMNFRAPCFDTSITPEWGQRVSIASQLKKAGKAGLDIIPLFPINYVPAFSISQILHKRTDATGNMYFNLSGTLPKEERNLSVLVRTVNALGETTQEALFEALYTPGASEQLCIYTDGSIDITKENYFLCVTNDDAEHNNEMLFSNALKNSEIIIIDGKTLLIVNFPTASNYSVSGKTLNITDGNISVSGKTLNIVF